MTLGLAPSSLRRARDRPIVPCRTAHVGGRGALRSSNQALKVWGL
jgi:hypothetical protein